jgi:ribosomal protein L24
MSIAKIQSGDKVKIIAGNYKGTIGDIVKVVKKVSKNGKIKIRASVSSVPKIAKYRKSSSFQGQSYPGLKTETDRFLDVSNLSLLTDDLKVSKVKISIDDKNKKTRVLKKTNEVIKKISLPKLPKKEEN